MNKITVVDGKLKEELNDKIAFSHLDSVRHFEVLEDTSIFFDLENSHHQFDIVIRPGVVLNVICKTKDTENQITYTLQKDSYVHVMQLGIDCKDRIYIHLNDTNAKIDYHYSTINHLENTFYIDVCHNANKTTSNIVNHGVNIKDRALVFDVNGRVPKTSENCICNQDTKIIELKSNVSSIRPNLFIDNYQVEANHAAYIGQFKESDLFYLMGRGIKKEKCYELLLRGFLLQDQQFDDELKEWFFSYLTITK